MTSDDHPTYSPSSRSSYPLHHNLPQHHQQQSSISNRSTIPHDLTHINTHQPRIQSNPPSPKPFTQSQSQSKSSPLSSNFQSLTSDHQYEPIPTHDMERVISLFGPPIKFYHQGFIFRRTVLHSDGLPPKRNDQNTNWSKYYIQIAGTTMSSWEAEEMNLAASQGRQVAPNYTNITDARAYLPSPQSSSSDLLQGSPTPHLFFLNSAGRNQLAFACSDQDSLISWVTAIRLATWERSRLFEIYTGTLLGLRIPNASADSPMSIKEKNEGWLMVRLPGDTEWTKVWCTVSNSAFNTLGPSPTSNHPKDDKWNRRSSLFNLTGFGNRSNTLQHKLPNSEGDSEPAMMFYSKKGNKKSLLGTLTAVTLAAAVYPESRALIDASTMFKIEGKFLSLSSELSILDHHKKLGPEGFILATPGEGSLLDMLGWLLGIMNAFTLYGRPNRFNFNPSDPLSFYYAYPLSSNGEHLFLERPLAEQLDVCENSLRQIRLGFSSLVATQKMQMTRKSEVKSQLTIDPSSHPSSPPSPHLEDETPLTKSPDSAKIDAQSRKDSRGPFTSTTENSSVSQLAYLASPETQTGLTDVTSPISSAPSTTHDKDYDSYYAGSRSPLSVLSQPVDPLPQNIENIEPIADDLENFAAYVSYGATELEDTPIKTQVTDTTPASAHTLISSSKSGSSYYSPPSKSPVPNTEPPLTSSSDGSTPQKSQSELKDEMEREDIQNMLHALSFGEEPVANQEVEKKYQDDEQSKETNLPPSVPSRSMPASPPAFLSQPPSSPQGGEKKVVEDTPCEPRTSFPSSFAAGKKGAARLAAAQAAQAAGKLAIHRPGKSSRSSVAPTKKPTPGTWNSDSEDEDEKEEEEEEDEEEGEEGEDEDERLVKHRQSHFPSAAEPLSAEKGPQAFRNTMNFNHQSNPSGMTVGRGSQLFPSQQGHEYSQYSGRPVSHFGNQSEIGGFPNPMSRREVPAVLRDQPATAGTDPAAAAGLRPAISEHGLLHRVMQERQEKSARSIQEAAHWSGEPLLHVNSKPPAPQTGLLGAIASHERDRKRDGGMGAVLTERARGRAIRQREDEMMQRQSMMFNPGGMGMGYGAPMVQGGMMPMMYNPQLMGVPTQGGMVPNPAYEQMLFQQHQMQMQMMAAQQAYMNSYNGYPGNGAMMNGHQSMYGALSPGNNPNNQGSQIHLPHPGLTAAGPSNPNLHQVGGSSNVRNSEYFNTLNNNYNQHYNGNGRS